MIKRFFNWLIKPPVLTFIGVLLLSLIVWFEAPLLAFDGKEPFADSGVRWFIIWMLFLAWACWFGWKIVSAKLANRRLMKSVAGEPNGAPAPAPGQKETAAEMALLAKRLQEAMAVLKKSRVGGGSAGLYQLPWYMFVGAPGSGKTTALVHSGLKFPLSDTHGKGAIGGVGGTRNCDWWFTDEAVLLDTAGRYTTQDSYTEVDKAAWKGFLQLLRKHRGRRPINGVIVALSVADLLQQGEVARRAQALAIRARIQELHEQLGIRFPVYVIVTKCDLLAGFVEFFDNLGRDDRTQVWGVTFPLAAEEQADAGLKSFPTEFDALQAQLQGRLLERMQQERDIQRRALMYNFPQQFAAIGDVLEAFLTDVFEATSYEQPALVRGVYFTSGTQEGSPIDRVMSTLAASFGLDRKVLPANAFGGRSYFITRLLREVIFQEKDLAGANLKLERNRRLLQWGAMALTAIMLVLVSAGLLGSYVRNRSYVDDVAARTLEIDRLARALPKDPSPLAALPLLNALRDIPGGYDDRGADVPFSMGMGLYQGGKLGEGSIVAYHRVLREALLPRILDQMETQLRRGPANNAEYLYELLRVYLMLGERNHLDPAAVRAWLEYDWARSLPEANEPQRQDLSRHVAAMLDPDSQAEAPPQLDAKLIAQVRLALAKMPMGERVYTRLKRELVASGLPDFDVTAVAGRDAAVVLTRQSGQPLTRGIPGAFTLAGYRKFTEQIDAAIADVVKDSWVLDQREAVTTPADAAQMKAAVQQMYYEDYIRQWDALLADVTLAPFTTLDQAARVIASVSGQESPLRKFLQAAVKQTRLDKVKSTISAVDAAASTVKQLGDAAKKRLESALNTGVPDVLPAETQPVNPVDQHFAPLHKMVEAGAIGTVTGLDNLLLKLKDVAAYFDAANSARAAGQPAPPADALAKLRRDADSLPPPLSALARNVDTAGSGLTLGTERDRLDALWKTGPALFCRAAIAGRYPVARKAALESTPDDFGRFFAPGGMADDFFQKHLANYVDTSGAQWRWRTVNNVSLGMGQDVLNEFQRAAQIRDKFFGGGGKLASVRFDLKPLAADASFTRVALDVDGQVLAFAPKAPQGAATFQIPSGKGVNGVRFDVAPAGVTELRTEGPWAWFRMLDKAVLEPSAQGERYKLTFDLEGRKMIYELTASSVNNPFRRDGVDQFRCLESL
ncbi:type VI secretion system membrane subunit TssM [Pseudoduganella namucuonensis]|uniref:Type VI secretion system protein ImpL n=1 Tax=Pseudoduganella namucuonensis TaxID=1035707 RepID=A0A1I7L5A3_9BURK|nr:type VI secretion system membrane subunit TssM [Pseudoduganella namucuonensis]SFV04684.1 type VI secretion system protein ImpL [Pseudoduganella namucuonensis]